MILNHLRHAYTTSPCDRPGDLVQLLSVRWACVPDLCDLQEEPENLRSDPGHNVGAGRRFYRHTADVPRRRSTATDARSEGLESSEREWLSRSGFISGKAARCACSRRLRRSLGCG